MHFPCCFWTKSRAGVAQQGLCSSQTAYLEWRQKFFQVWRSFCNCIFFAKPLHSICWRNLDVGVELCLQYFQKQIVWQQIPDTLLSEVSGFFWVSHLTHWGGVRDKCRVARLPKMATFTFFWHFLVVFLRIFCFCFSAHFFVFWRIFLCEKCFFAPWPLCNIFTVASCAAAEFLLHVRAPR